MPHEKDRRAPRVKRQEHSPAALAVVRRETFPEKLACHRQALRGARPETAEIGLSLGVSALEARRWVARGFGRIG